MKSSHKSDRWRWWIGGFGILVPILMLHVAATWASDSADEVIKDIGLVTASRTSIDVSFSFTNSLGKPLIIERLMTTCHCTQVLYPKTPIAPGASIHFDTHVDLREWRGNAAAGFLVEFKDTLHAPIVYKIKFYRAAPLEPTPKII